MKTSSHHTVSRGSITIGVVFGLGLLSMTLATLALSSVTNNMGTHRNELSGLRTFVTADSAAREGVYRFLHSENFNGATDWAMLESGEDVNAVLASAITIDRSTWPNIKLQGSAENLLTERAVQYIVRNSDLALAFDHAIYSQHNLNITGSVSVEGSIYAAGSINIDASGAVVDGNAYAFESITVHKDDNINGDMVQNTVELAPPDIDSEPYKTNNKNCYAIDGQKNQDIKDLKWNLCDVIYIRPSPSDPLKEIVFSGPHAGFEGVVFVEGVARINGGDFSCPDECDNPLAIYVDGDLRLPGNATVRGLVYITGKTTVGTGNIDIQGSLVSIGGIDGVDVSGNVNVTYDPELMSGWRDVEGLSFTAGVDDTVKVSDWTEL